MSLLQLYSVPKTPEELAAWSFSHQASHRDLNRLIFQKKGIVLPEYILDPVNPNDQGVWLDQHQDLHNRMDSVLGIQGYNMEELDFKNPIDMAQFIAFNSLEHYIASQILGLNA